MNLPYMTDVVSKAVNTSSLPLSGLFAVDKPAGIITMKLLDSINELLATSALFLPAATTDINDSKNDRYHNSKKRKRPSRAGKVKLGQGGTLDPLASGVLVLGVNDGTKRLSGFLHGTKEYRATGLLGCATDSYDAEGKKVRDAPFKHVTREKVEAVLSRFRGDIKQLPPIYSAIKMDGKPLYHFARTGTPLPKPIEPRSCTIYNLELVNFAEGGQHPWKAPEQEIAAEDKEALEKLERMVQQNTEGIVDSEADKLPEATAGSTSADGAEQPEESQNDLPAAFEIKMTVSSGTYVRSIIHDIGIALGSAAHVVELIRTRQGQFTLDAANVHRLDSEDSLELHKVIPWKTFEDGIQAMKTKKARTEDGTSDAETKADKEDEGEQQTPWEKAVVQALL